MTDRVLAFVKNAFVLNPEARARLMEAARLVSAVLGSKLGRHVLFSSLGLSIDWGKVYAVPRGSQRKALRRPFYLP